MNATDRKVSLFPSPVRAILSETYNRRTIARTSHNYFLLFDEHSIRGIIVPYSLTILIALSRTDIIFRSFLFLWKSLILPSATHNKINGRGY